MSLHAASVLLQTANRRLTTFLPSRLFDSWSFGLLVAVRRPVCLGAISGSFRSAVSFSCSP